MLENKLIKRISERVFCDITNVTNNDSDKSKSNIDTINELFKQCVNISPRQDANILNSTYNFSCDNSIYCKDNLSVIQNKHNKLLLPRVFQHHDIPEWLKTRYLEIDPKFEIFINSNFKTSPCNSIRHQIDMQDDYCHIDNFDDSTWIDFKYGRIMNGDKEILCRFCYGKNWINEDYIYEHLFGSHGIVTYFSEDDSNLMKINIRLLPLPINYKIERNCSYMSTQKTKVLCGTCQKWIELGNGSNTVNENDKVTESLKWRKLHGIRGFYENYFRHYISCKEMEHNKTHFIS